MRRDEFLVPNWVIKNCHIIFTKKKKKEVSYYLFLFCRLIKTIDQNYSKIKLYYFFENKRNKLIIQNRLIN